MNRIAKIILKIPIRGGVGKAFNLLNFGGFMRYSVCLLYTSPSPRDS